MRRRILQLFFLVASFLCAAPQTGLATTYSLEQRFAAAQKGDFIVTAQEGNYSLLFIRSISPAILLLEEIAVPQHQIDLKKIKWKQWLSNKAPGHTSWTLYEIDRNNGKLIECFSYSKNGWLYLDETEQFLTRLFTLQLNKVPEKERKKIGPQPVNQDEDRRAFWNPPLIIEGKKVSKPYFDVLKARWPDDGSQLSSCFIELYFSKENPAFPFPYWLEIQSPHYAFKMRTIDSGHNLSSPMAGPMPHRLPQILGLTQKAADKWKITVKTPAYFQKFHLFALDLSADSKTTIPVPFLNKTDNEELILEVATVDLNRILQNQHRYRWILIPESTSIRIESEEVFIWNR